MYYITNATYIKKDCPAEVLDVTELLIHQQITLN